MRRISIVGLAGILGAALIWAPLVTAAPPVDSSDLRDAVTVAGIRDHQAALQAIADANGGTRASGTPGYEASVDYVAEKLGDAGYTPEVRQFPFAFFQEFSPSQLFQTAPGTVTYTNGEDFQTMDYSGAGDVTAPVQAVDLLLPPTGGSTSGCEAADFAGFTTGNIALIQRGTCTFHDKAANAAAAGAAGVIIFNEGNTPDRVGLLLGTLGTPLETEVPVVGTTFALGNTLSGIDGLEMRIVTDTASEIRQTWNVLAETAGGRSDRVVVVGAHLDSVLEGPGINDNGSGSATILEIAEQMADITPRNKVRFAFWGAEESGLLGSEHYVSQLSARDIKNIQVNLNFDMVGSPNFVRFVYDGDGSGTGTSGPNGSKNIEQVYLDYFAGTSAPETEPTAFDGRSDYGPFIAVGIPAGGLFTGAEGIKTAAQVAIYGGTAGEQYDPCYHEVCDTFANNSDTALDQMSDAATHSVLEFAQTTSAVNGTDKGSAKGLAKNMQKFEFRGSHLQK